MVLQFFFFHTFYSNFHAGVIFSLAQGIQSWGKGWRQIHEIKQNRVFYGIFLIFWNILPKNVKIWVLGGRQGTGRQIKTFQGLS